MKSCAKCKQPIKETKGVGRNKTYCSAGCRRAAELEIRRINERLVKLENVAQEFRLNNSFISSINKEEDILAEIKRQEDRLKELLSDPVPCENQNQQAGAV